MLRFLRWTVAKAAFCALLVQGLAENIYLSDHATVTFVEPEQGRRILTHRDEFIVALSPFDRAARLHTDQPVSNDKFLQLLAQSVLPWSATDSNRVTAALIAAARKLQPWQLPFPPVLLIKTTGREEGHAAYTREQAVIIPQGEVNSSPANLERLLLHEFFHVLSRQNPSLRRALYRIIGFSEINDIQLPDPWDRRRITNPDGVHNRWLLTTTNGAEVLHWVPVLYSSTESYDLKKGGEFFDYLLFNLLAVQRRGTNWAPIQKEGAPILIEPSTIPGFQTQIGNNTSYIIHPDEILADNFVLLINGQTNVPSPAILTKMRSVFQNLPQ